MGLDSVELIMEVEKYFSISIPDKEAEKADTVGKLVDCVATILNIDKYDFDLRERTFLCLKDHLFKINKEQKDFSITDKVRETINIEDKSLIIELEKSLDLTLPGINKSQTKNSNLLKE
jgi:hypothetical protein